ncbi:MAG: trimethylamine methyltransferase family protein [Anaerolineales bacterium]|nr:trimethylamine methyltransferase family protein [Anaerolineales bacterium]
MQPQIKLLSAELIPQIIDEAFQLMMKPGIKVQLKEARNLLAEAGARVDEDRKVVYISERLVRESIDTVPKEFFLHNRTGEPTVHYGGDHVHFDPGSSGINILDGDTLQHKPATTPDLVKIIKIAESLSQYDAQSTSLVCSEIPKEIGDLYRLYLVLLHSNKPIVTGAFSSKTTGIMVDMLSIFAGGSKALAEKPLAVFDVCPSPPLIWSEFGAQNLIDLAHAGVPAQIVSMPLAGAAAPVTLIGSVVQHAAECLSGMTIHQLANPGSPIVWGGAPAIMDMRQGTTPMGAIETAMIDTAYAQVGKSFGFPTHTYLGASDSKLVDGQAGMESGISAMIGALAGINMISGAGMLDFLACMSPEKLVIDAEAIGMAQRMLRGIEIHTTTLATEMFEGIDFKGDFLKQKTTRNLVRKEQYLPSSVIDRGSIRTWQQQGSLDVFERAKGRVNEILLAYEPPSLPKAKVDELANLVKKLAYDVGMDELPALDI